MGAASSGASQPAEPGATQNTNAKSSALRKRPAAALVQQDGSCSLMEAMRALGRMPRRSKNPEGDAQIEENNLAKTVARALESNKLSEEDKAELDELRDASRAAPAEELMDAVRRLGYYPKELSTPTTDQEQQEAQLAMMLRRRLRRNCRAGLRFSIAQQDELKELRRTSIHPRDRDRSAQLLEEAQEPSNPMECFADEAENRLDQDLLLAIAPEICSDASRST